jgi:hypothetical protein
MEGRNSKTNLVPVTMQADTARRPVTNAHIDVRKILQSKSIATTAIKLQNHQYSLSRYCLLLFIGKSTFSDQESRDARFFPFPLPIKWIVSVELAFDCSFSAVTGVTIIDYDKINALDHWDRYSVSLR